VRSVMVRMAGSGLLMSLATACSDPSPICTADSRPGIEVEVRDRASNQFISVVARGVVQDGAFQDSLQLWGMTADDPPVPVSYAAAFERRGVYTVSLQVDGYHRWDTSGIAVSRDECHVRTVNLFVALQQRPTPLTRR
jgi:hypothetical protein